MSPRVVVPITVLVAGAALAACGAPEREQAETGARGAVRVSAGSIRAGDPVPRPEGAAVLRVRGVSHGNAGRATTMDLATLERLPRVSLRLYEPFLKRDMTFEGVRLSELLRIAGAPTAASSVYLHALDDYHVTLPLAKLSNSGAVLATRADGRALPTAEGGPVRLVFPDRTELSENTDNWIWSVDSIRAIQ